MNPAVELRKRSKQKRRQVRAARSQIIDAAWQTHMERFDGPLRKWHSLPLDRKPMEGP